MKAKDFKIGMRVRDTDDPGTGVVINVSDKVVTVSFDGGFPHAFEEGNDLKYITKIKDSNLRFNKSRNKREGKFIPGWCYNPEYLRKRDKNGQPIPKTRAGANFVLVAVRGFNDGGFILPGVTFVRYIREGAYQ